MVDRRHLCRTLLAAGVWSALGAGEALGAPLSADAADADSYAIWSLLIPVLEPAPKGYLIPDLTYLPGMVSAIRAETPHTPIERAVLRSAEVNEIEVPAASMAEFTEAAAAFKALRDRPVRLEPRLHLDRPCLVLDQGGLQEYSRIAPPLCVWRPWHRDRALERKYAAYSPPCMFSRVFFSKTRHLGLVWAGNATGAYKTYAFRRQEAGWRIGDWAASASSYNC